MPSKRKTKKTKVSAKAPATSPSDMLQEPTAPTIAADPVLVHEEGSSLGESLCKALMEGASTEHVVNDLLRIYMDCGKETVCCAVLNLVGKASGAAQAELDVNALRDDVDITTILEEMYARVPQDAAVYPFVRKESKYRVFRTAFRRFFSHLVELGYNANILLDGVLLPTLIRWLIAMSESKARCFRHTSIVALLSIVGSLNGLIRDLNNRLPSQRRGKNKEVNALQESIKVMVELRDYVISQAIHQRPRDVAPEIRLLVFEHMEKWIINYYEEFAENKYFRYFGMALYDKRPEIRAEALTMIQRSLKATPENKNRMFLFLQYFISRLVEMCSDVSMRCAELAIGVIILILRTYGEELEGKELLDNDMIDRVLLTLFDERPTIRHEAGILLRVFIDSRVPTDDTSGVAYQKSAMELLCAFASTLRSQYGEAMPERYLIDALYNSAQELPSFLKSYSTILEFVTSDNSSEVVVGLQLAAALLEKLRGKLDLGPVPKEDRRYTTTSTTTTTGAAKKLPANKQEMIDSLVTSLSRDVGVLLSGVLEKHRGEMSVLSGVSAVISAMDFSAFTSMEHVSRINGLITLMRKITTSLPYTEGEHNDQMVSAWLSFTVESHPLKSEAKGQIQELLKQVLKQLSALQKMNRKSGSQSDEMNLLHVWGRMNILSSLVSIVNQWDLLKASILNYINVKSSPGLLRLILSTSFRCILWQMNTQEEGTDVSSQTTNGTVSQMIGEFVTCIFQLWETASQREDATCTSLLLDTIVYLCDLCALRYYTMSQMEQDVFLGKFSDLSATLDVDVREAKENLKKAGESFSEGGSLSTVAKSRRDLVRLEASQLRMTTGVARLLLLNRLGEDVAPRVFLQWLHAPTKSIADVFRFLFRTLRDRCGESFAIEKSILLATYNHSPDALYQMGMKLSSMHWPLPDKYYAACVSVVRFGMEFATTTDPVILQAIAAYCPKLLKTDALGLAHALAANETLASSTDPNARMFISALRRAARLEEVRGAAVTPVRCAHKRTRGDGVGETSKSVEPDESNGDYNDHPRKGASGVENEEETAGMPPGKTAPAAKSRRRNNNNNSAAMKARLVEPNRVITEGGWRVRPGEEREREGEETAASMTSSMSEIVETTRLQQTRGVKRQSPALPLTPLPAPTQETILSSLAAELDNDEVFIATQEYD